MIGSKSDQMGDLLSLFKKNVLTMFIFNTECMLPDSEYGGVCFTSAF